MFDIDGEIRLPCLSSLTFFGERIDSAVTDWTALWKPVLTLAGARKFREVGIGPVDAISIQRITDVPTLESLNLQMCRGIDLTPLFDPGMKLSSLKTLQLQYVETDGTLLRSLFTSESLRGLRKIDVTGVYFTEKSLDGIKVVQDQLEELNLSSTGIGDAIFSELCQLEFNALRSLDLCDTHLTDDGIKVMVETNAFPNLTSLDLSRNLLTEQSGSHLNQASFLEQLESLDLSTCRPGLGDDGIVAILHGKKLHKLQRLSLYQYPSKIHGACLKALASSLGRIREIDLSFSELPIAEFRLFCDSGVLDEADIISLSGTRLGDACVEYMVKNGRLKSIRSLGLALSGITVDAVPNLLSNVGSTIQFLDLSNNALGEAVVEHLLTAPFVNLVELSLFPNNLSKSGTMAIAESETGRRLRRFYVPSYLQ